ncbi:hypothetical protein LJC00_00440 [Dysgonomonas sp. OttesenSCG-928-M03]|nr:hypothetical protein [Dysgonomonas sp. OttesenSCG-928-M03]
MDLDKIKKSWQNTDPKLNINKEKIQMMLDNTQKGAFNILMRYEKVCILLLVLMLPLALFFPNIVVSRFLIVSLVAISIWQFYRYNLLRKTNFAHMGVIEISVRIAKYRRLISYGLILGIVWLLIYLPVYCFFAIHNNKDFNYGKYISSEIHAIALFCILSISLTALVVWFMYKKVIMKNISTIQNILEEVKEFEESCNESEK